MVESTLFESRPDSERIGRRKKPATLAMSTLVHILIGGALILIPLLQTQAVPPVALPPPPVQMASPARFVKLVAAARPAGSGSSSPTPAVMPDTLIAPTAIPERIAYVADAIVIGPDIEGYAGLKGAPSGNGIGIGSGGPGIFGGNGDGFAPTAVPPPPTPIQPPPPPKIQVREPLRVSSGHQNSLLVHRVDPIYPSLARTARVEGTVIAEARISNTGAIEDLRIISGHTLFRQSVLDAVKQWRYRPTLLNGEPIDVVTTITVNFTLN